MLFVLLAVVSKLLLSKIMYLFSNVPGFSRGFRGCHKTKIQLVHQENNVKTSAEAEEIAELLPALLRTAIYQAKEKGSSTWLTALPLVEHGFALHKGAFHDALALRYGCRKVNGQQTA